MPKLEVLDVVMQFPAVRALDGVSIAFEAGQVHGVIGENGAGKSTLMKILSGVQRPTSGSIRLDGADAHFSGVREAQKHGIAMIHQELNLVDELTVYENVFLGRELTQGGILDRAQMIAQTEGFLKEVHASFAATASVGDLSIAGKQLVEIAKAVSIDASILIMDEPTAVLSEPEARALFDLIAKLKTQGKTILYISHRLAEVCEICDRITVLRDGAKVASLEAKGAEPAKLADLMVGRPLQDFYPPKQPAPDGPPVLEFKGISVRAGEIVGLAGLVGAGRTELAEEIVGLRAPRKTGVPLVPGPTTFQSREPSQPEPVLRDLKIAGHQTTLKSPREAMRHGVAYVSEDRKHLGLHLSLSAVHNITMANLRAFGHVLRRQKEQESAKEWQKRLDIRAGDLDDAVLNISGGNQQKISIAKWLETKPRILILDEPTRGVDVGAKREMYDLIQQLAADGLACIVISSDLPEIIGLCHRALVMRDGRIVGELPQDQLTEEAVMRLAAGVAA